MALCAVAGVQRELSAETARGTMIARLPVGRFSVGCRPGDRGLNTWCGIGGGIRRRLISVEWRPPRHLTRRTGCLSYAGNGGRPRTNVCYEVPRPQAAASHIAVTLLNIRSVSAWSAPLTQLR